MNQPATLRSATEIAIAATDSPKEMPALPPSPGPAIDHTNILKSAASAADREAMMQALAEYDSLQKIHRGLEVPHLAVDARAKLEAAGISTTDDDTFWHLYLARRDEIARTNNDWTIDQRIVAKLADKAAVILGRVRRAALVELDRILLELKPIGSAHAERFGLPASTIYSPLFLEIAHARNKLNAVLDAPVDLGLCADRRGLLSNFFAGGLS